MGLNLCIRFVIISCSALILECGSCRRGLLFRFDVYACVRVFYISYFWKKKSLLAKPIAEPI